MLLKEGLFTVWAQFFGRFHPLVVHLPIGILIFGAIIHWFYLKEKSKKRNSLVKLTLLWTFITSLISCGFGYLLSLSGEYEETMLSQHQNMGLLLAISSGVIYAMLQTPYVKNYINGIIRWIYLFFILMISITGHLGGNLTHGEGYLSQFTPPPFRYWMGMDTLNLEAGGERKIDLTTALIYEDLIEPIMQQKCWSCHNDKKQKGNLRMDSYDFLMKGGKHGKIIVGGNSKDSELLVRVNLEESHDEHMPPKGKLGLTKTEILLIEWWINEGAKKGVKYQGANLPKEVKDYINSLNSEDGPRFSKIILEEIEPIQEAKLRSFKEKGIILNTLSMDNNHLEFNSLNYSDLKDEDLDGIEDLKDHLVYLKIARTKISNASAKRIKQLENLVKLDVSGNNIDDEFVKEIMNLPYLEVLNLYNTKISKKTLEYIKNFKSLKKVFLYGTKVDSNYVQDSKAMKLSIGSYTKGNQGGISFVEFNKETNTFKKLDELDQKNASFQAFTNDGEYFYSVTEFGRNSTLVAYKKTLDGKYEKLNQLSTKGEDPCYIELGPNGMIYTANYSGGNISVFSTKEGKLNKLEQLIEYKGSSKNKDRQESSHPHKVVISPDSKFVFIPDLGTDKIYRHKILRDGKLGEKEISAELEPGSGPRHLVFHPNGKFAYLITELSGEVYYFYYQDGKLTLKNKYLVDDSKAKTKGSAHISISPNQEFLMISNRISKEELVCFRIGEIGSLKKVFSQKVGPMPRFFLFSKDGKILFVGSQSENYIQAYKFNLDSGEFSPLGEKWAIESPVCFNQLD